MNSRSEKITTAMANDCLNRVTEVALKLELSPESKKAYVVLANKLLIIFEQFAHYLEQPGFLAEL